MKNAFLFHIATLVLFFGLQDSIHAQKTATWKGGTPGKAADWECPTNWKEGRVPDEFSCVIIPDVSTSTFTYPVIEHDVEILSISCSASTMLNVRNNAQVILLNAALNEPVVRSDNFAQTGKRKERF